MSVSFNRFGVVSRTSPSGNASMEGRGKPLVPNEYLDTMIDWQKEKYKTYSEESDHPKFTEPEPEGNEEKRWWKFRYDLHHRNLTQTDYDWLKKNLDSHGLHVRLRLDPLPVNENMYSKQPEYWDEEEGVQKTCPLLQFRIERGDKFVEMSGREFLEQDIVYDYHISLCFTNELHRFDLLHSDNGVKLGKEAYNRLREIYDGQEAILYGTVRNFSFEVKPGTEIQGGLPDFYENHDFIRLHNAGSYANREEHISM